MSGITSTTISRGWTRNSRTVHRAHSQVSEIQTALSQVSEVQRAPSRISEAQRAPSQVGEVQREPSQVSDWKGSFSVILSLVGSSSQYSNRWMRLKEYFSGELKGYLFKTNYWFAAYFADMQLMQIIGDLFGAGTETTSNTLLWYVYFRGQK